MLFFYLALFFAQKKVLEYKFSRHLEIVRVQTICCIEYYCSAKVDSVYLANALQYCAIQEDPYGCGW